MNQLNSHGYQKSYKMCGGCASFSVLISSVQLIYSQLLSGVPPIKLTVPSSAFSLFNTVEIHLDTSQVHLNTGPASLNYSI